MSDAERSEPAGEFLSMILQCLPAFVVAADRQLRFTAIRGNILQSVSVTQADIDRLIGMPAEQYFVGPEGEAIMQQVRKTLQGESVSFEASWHGRWFSAHAAPLRDASGAIVGSVGVGMDITRRHDLEQHLECERNALADAERLAELGSWQLDIPSGSVRISESLARLLGIPFTKETLQMSDLEHFFSPHEYAMIRGERERMLQNTGSYDFDHQIVRPDGTVRYVRSRGHVDYADDSKPRRCIGTMLDITARVEAQRMAELLAYHDPVTGLPNRWLLRDRLTQAIAHARREHRKFHVLFIDLDNFKRINDTLGHRAGDLLLNEVGQRLRHATRRTDTVARMGGDEFVVIFGEVENDEQLDAAIGKLQAAIRAPFHLLNNEYRITASIGVAMYPDDAANEDELLQNADAAMYDAKQQGRNAVQRHRSGKRELDRGYPHLEVEVPRALRDAEFRLYYQPVLDAKTLRIAGVEALLRWQHPTRGLLLPAAFMDAMEDGEFTKTIGEWVIRQACAQVSDWSRQFSIPLRLSVNVSAHQMLADRLPAVVSKALRDAHMDPSSLEIDVTETAIVHDLEWATALLGEMRGMGVGIAIDDFATGYNSLGYLKHFPVTALKIDRSFVGEIGSDAYDEAVSSALATLGKALRIRVVAEGVETQEQCERLRAFGCDELQGYYFAPPLDAASLAAKLAARGAG